MLLGGGGVLLGGGCYYGGGCVIRWGLGCVGHLALPRDVI